MSEHPFFFTWTAQHGAKPLELVGGKGAWFTTSDGGSGRATFSVGGRIATLLDVDTLLAPDRMGGWAA